MHVLGGLASITAGVPWGLREAADVSAYPPGWKTWLMTQLGRRASFVVSNSGSGDRFWESVSNRPRRWVIRNGVDVAAISDAPPATPAQGRRILFAGRFEQQKNIVTMIAALCDALSSDHSLSALLCGEGAQRLRAEQEVAARNLTHRIHFAGFRPDLWSLMKGSDLFVSVSHFEGSPNTVLEAMACSCPLLVSDIVTHNELIDNTTAVIVDRNDPAAIVAGIREVFSDPEATRRRTAKAREAVEAMSIENMARQYEAVYRIVTAAKARAA